jgi:SRSO17 transposase
VRAEHTSAAARDHVCVTRTRSRTAAALSVEAQRAERIRGELMTRFGPMFVRIEPRLQATKYVRALLSDLPKRNGWTIAEWVGDRQPDATQRLLSHARWDTLAVMSEIRRFAVARLDATAPCSGLTVGALDESGQEKKGAATAGVKRQHMGCAGGIDNGINTVHLAYIRGGSGHALIASRQPIPAEQVADPVAAMTMALPLDLAFRTKGELAIDLLADAYADGVSFDFIAGDEVYGACTLFRSKMGLRGLSWAYATW